MFCPMTASPMRAMSATGSDMAPLLVLGLLAALKQMPTAKNKQTLCTFRYVGNCVRTVRPAEGEWSERMSKEEREDAGAIDKEEELASSVGGLSFSLTNHFGNCPPLMQCWHFSFISKNKNEMMVCSSPYYSKTAKKTERET